MKRPPERVALSFAGHPDPDGTRRQLSSVVRVGDELWLGGDEGATLERLAPRPGSGYGGLTTVRIADLVDLPGSEDDEVDIEGLDFANGWLWVVGSHAARRAQPDDEDDDREQLRHLARVKRRGNRFLLARIPMRETEGGRWEPAREDASVDGAPRAAARLRGGRKNNALTRALRDDDHLAPFLEIPGKDNGLDVEGLAVAEGRVFLGLRGPVLRGWAVVLGLDPKPEADDPSLLRLARVGHGGRHYEKHVLDLRGLGVRELVVDGDDLLVLAAPTMVLDGRAAVFRWRGGAHARGDTVVPRDALEHEIELPYGVGEEGIEHPEGCTLMPRADGGRGLLVLYDSPREDRLRGDDAVDADLYALD